MRTGGSVAKVWIGAGLSVALIVSGVATAGAAPTASPTPAVPKTWAVQPSPNRGAGANHLVSVSCPAVSACMAVGSVVDGSSLHPLAMTWDGSDWRLSPLRSRHGYDSQFLQVSCANPTSCIAVGSERTGTKYVPLSELWNGSTWTKLANPPHGERGILKTVDCVSATMCMALGVHLEAQQPIYDVFQVWDGAKWTVVRRAGTAYGASDISCPTATECVAVGTQGPSLNSSFVETWNGTEWFPGESPHPGDGSRLNAVSCASATDCVAVGGYFDDSVDHSLFEHWDGTTWTQATSAAAGKKSESLNDVTCSSPTDCVAVGEYLVGRTERNLILTDSGAGWSVAPSPDRGAGSNVLSGVTCTDAANCTAVGTSKSVTGPHTLVLTGSS